MRRPLILAAAVLVAATTACSFQNKDEKRAQKITEAIVANDFAPVKDDISPGINISRVQIAEWSDELNAQGKLKSVKEDPAGCAPSYHCFDVQFEKRLYREQMLVDDKGKVAKFSFHMADATPAPAR